MLIACPTCHRQYDAGTHPPGAKVRCVCGVRIEVPEPVARDVRMLHCSSCGAGLESGSTDCGWCGASVGLGAKGLGDVCPECMSRLVAGARFCSGCGVEIAPQSVIRALADLDCPRCKQRLSECVATGTRMIECTGCAGLWIDEETFERFTRERERKTSGPIPGAPRPAKGKPAAPRYDVAYLPCPACSQPMHRKNFAKRSGVIIDWCKGHGWWFDADELERITRFIEEGGLLRARQHEAEDAERRVRSAQSRAARRQASVELERRTTTGPTRYGGNDLIGSLVDFVTDLFR